MQLIEPKFVEKQKIMDLTYFHFVTSLKLEITSYSDNGYNVSDLFVPLKSLLPIKFRIYQVTNSRIILENPSPPPPR